MNTKFIMNKNFMLASLLSVAAGLAGCKASESAQAVETELNEEVLQEVANNTASESVIESVPMDIPRRPNVSQQFTGIDLVSIRLATVLDELPYEVDGLDAYATAVNTAVWSEAMMDEAVVLRIQALLNWHHHSIGAVDGVMNANTIKAMQIFQEANNLPVTQSMNQQTWQALFGDANLNKQPVLVRYELTQDDVKLNGGRSGYKSKSEAVAEKFHMSQALLKSLNPEVELKAGNVITVYNPYQPNQVSVSRVLIKKKENILYAYDKEDNLVASYPTTVNPLRSPKGTYKVANRVIDPYYNKDFRNKAATVPPGPNNPVGRVWIGISKPSFGIHGSPEPERISQQVSAGCVRLTNWDALGLFGAIEHEASVEFV